MSTNKKKQPEPEPQEEVYKPMAVTEPSPLERLEAVEMQTKAMKDWINRHSRSHTGRDAI
jgi:hypothetical protein